MFQEDLPQARPWFRRDQLLVGLQPLVEASATRVRDQLEEILSQEDLAAAEREIERSGARQGVQERRELTRRQLRPPLDHPVAVDAVLVAAHGEVDVDGERDVPRRARPEE